MPCIKILCIDLFVALFTSKAKESLKSEEIEVNGYIVSFPMTNSDRSIESTPIELLNPPDNHTSYDIINLKYQDENGNGNGFYLLALNPSRAHIMSLQ